MDRRIVGLGLAVLLGACGAGAEHRAASVLRLTGEDRELVSPTPVYTLGSADGGPHASFSHLAHVAFDGAENLYVLDRGAGKVFAYDQAGRFVREIGRPGNGPGELAFPIRLAVTPEGTVVVSDLRKREYVLFDAGGNYRGTLPYAYRHTVGGLEVRPHPVGGFVSENQPLPRARGDAARIRLTWHSLANRSPRLLAAVAWSPDHLATAVAGPRETAFLPRFTWGVLPTGEAVVAHTEAYRIDIFSPDGTPVRTLERPIDPRTVTAGDRREERRRRFADLTEDAASVPMTVRQAALNEVGRLRFAPVLPVIEDLAVDPAGRIWVRRGTWADPRAGRIDLISGEGAYLGTLRGERLPVAFSRGGLAAFVDEDSLGVQRVTVSRLPAGWRPGP